ncbi:ferroxidase fet3 [Coemansia guatemalensis]|uniref:Ferroxidase fet3 n=1 Tax=Coemansia guatemalensis TaxID=2761395 RepID=A0A9W8LU89_9FUNG|nr:ferroxidase fet3 [Coemansia guatemalensis]
MNLKAARQVVSWDIGYVYADHVGGPREAIGVNGKLPIPPVHITEGDTFVLHVHNSLNVSTSIHAHGIFQTNTNHMDGAAMVTQCGIPPGESFTYEYEVNQAGTFWLHGHYHHQNADGLRTPLIVHDRQQPPFDYDDEYVFGFADWYNQTYKARLDETLDPNGTFPPPSPAPNALINGVDGNVTKPMFFKPNRTYRIRLINMSATVWFKFALPGHQMRVIEVDGKYSEPLEVSGITLGPAQRFSVLVTAYDDITRNYQYLVEVFASFFPRIPGESPKYYTGVVEYSESASLVAVDPISVLESIPEDKSFSGCTDVELTSLDRQPAFPVDRSIDLVLRGALFTDNVTRDIINNITYTEPHIPTLYSALSLGSLAVDKDLYGIQSNAFVLQHNEYIELIVHNPNTIPHPMHLHGHAFQLIEYGPVDPRIVLGDNRQSLGNQTAPVVRASAYPMQRDTVVIPTMQYARLRFQADNPGVWLFHCHMDIHFGMGMAMTFIEAPSAIQDTITIPESMAQMCVDQGIGIFGNGAGNPGSDLSGLPPMPTIKSF